MTIQLRQDVPIEPLHVNVARPVPLHLAPMARVLTDELLQAGSWSVFAIAATWFGLSMARPGHARSRTGPAGPYGPGSRPTHECPGPPSSDSPLDDRVVKRASLGPIAFIRATDFGVGLVVEVEGCAAIINLLWDWLFEFGRPENIRSDGGPQFRSDFQRFCDEIGAFFTQSSPGNSRSNGLAEAAVKLAKSLVLKCGTGRALREALVEQRNTPRADGISPSMAFFGRRLRGVLPALPNPPIPGREGHGKPKVPVGQGVPLRGLKVGDCVRIQDFVSKRWNLKGKVVTDHGDRSYDVMTVHGKILWRNRRFLLPVPAWDEDGEDPVVPDALMVPRRSRRQAGVPGPENIYPASPVPVSKASPVPVSKVSPVPVSKASPVPVSKVSPVPVSKASPVPVSKVSPVPVSKASPAPSTVKMDSSENKRTTPGLDLQIRRNFRLLSSLTAFIFSTENHLKGAGLIIFDSSPSNNGHEISI
eukprot:snap_masked-scaffold1126_size61158-processed-gene-0.1 protein:Tk03414 transcript:snap_masked-scaffold1126_size61158-processed-gene-0.1-mRNA-1 annotation:"PREDICTED: uncharacterized protein LOC101063392"